MEARTNSSSTPEGPPPESTPPVNRPREDGYNEYQQPPLKKAKESKVWLDFKKIIGPTASENTAVCNHCKVVMSANSKNGTSHLQRHIDKCPLKVHTDIRQYMLAADTNADGSAVLSKFKFDEAEGRRLVMMYIVEDLKPFDTVEKRGFRRMAKGFNPQYKHFSRHTARRELFKMYFKERDIVKEELLNAPGKISMTTDNWKNKHNNEEYICVTAHFVDSNWHLQKRILRFRCLVPPYDSTCISDEIILFLQQWNLEHKVFTFTTDNASYTLPMVNKIKNHILVKNSLVGGGSFFYIRCCAHILNLVVQSGLDSIAEILNSIRNMVKCIDRSPARRKKFFEIAEKNFKLCITKRFRLDTPVRWNSTYILIDRALYYKDVFIYFGERDLVVKSFTPSLDDWDKVAFVGKFLKVFYDVTHLFSASKHPTANSYAKGVWKIQFALMEIAKGPCDFLGGMIHDMQAKFDKYWGEYNLVLSCATVLDPRYKVTFLKYCFGKVYGVEGYGYRVERVVSALRMWFEEYKRSNSNDATNNNASSSSITGGNFTTGQPEFEDYAQFVTEERSNVELGKSELDLYLEEPIRPMDDDIDILDYWFKCSARYPILSIMARDLLTIPVSTVASESAFSIDGKTISPCRSSLKPKTVQALVCLRDWIIANGEECEDSSSSDEDDYEDIDGENVD